MEAEGGEGGVAVVIAVVILLQFNFYVTCQSIVHKLFVYICLYVHMSVFLSV